MKKFKHKKIFIFFLIELAFCIQFVAHAREIKYLVRSPRALLMGDAFTALADDEYTLYYNPAALGRNDGVRVTPLNPSFQITNFSESLDIFDEVPDDAGGIADKFTGFPTYLSLGVHPGIKAGPFAFGLFAENKTGLVLRNKTHQSLDISYRYDRGFVFGGAFSFGSGGKKDRFTKSSKPGSRTSFGLGFKYIKREGFEQSFDLFGTRLLTVIENNPDDLGDVLDALGRAKGSGWGIDLGVDHIITNGSTDIIFAASVLNAGGIKFTKKTGEFDVPEQEMHVNTGMSFAQNFTFFDYAFSLDLKPLNVEMDFGRKVHFGARASIPFVTLFTGWNEGYTSIGFEFDIGLLSIVAGLYNVELATNFKEERGARGVLYFSFFDADVEF